MSSDTIPAGKPCIQDATWYYRNPCPLHPTHRTGCHVLDPDVAPCSPEVHVNADEWDTRLPGDRPLAYFVVDFEKGYIERVGRP